MKVMKSTKPRPSATQEPRTGDEAMITGRLTTIGRVENGEVEFRGDKYRYSEFVDIEHVVWDGFLWRIKY